MNTRRFDTAALVLFYYLFVAFVAASMVGIEGNAAFYASLLPFLLLACVLVIVRVGGRASLNLQFLLLTLILIPILFSPPFVKHSIYIRLLICEFILLFYIFSEHRLTLNTFSRFINITYILYLTLSVADWLGLIPLVPHHGKNSFFIQLGGTTIETLYGIGGSTADIDSYSGLILVWNLFVNRGGAHRTAMIALSLLAMILTFRFTPLVAVVAAGLSFYLVQNRLLALMAILVPAILFVGVLFILQVNPNAKMPIMPDTDWYSFLWNVTHARSSIWLGQIDYYLTAFQLSDFFVGPLDERMTVDFIDGEGHFHKDSYNPHNTYLMLLFRSSIFLFILYSLFLIGVGKRSRRNTFPVIFFVSIVAYTNAGIISVQNPIFLLVIMYLLMSVPPGMFRSRYDIRHYNSTTVRPSMISKTQPDRLPC